MMLRGIIAGCALVAAGLIAGCGGDGNISPFVGNWASATAGRLSFDEKHWSDGDGDSGDYVFSGSYPEFNVIFKSSAGQFQKHATFVDVHTFELCTVGTAGALFACNDFVWDKPTLH